jgi:hypothetical protein
MTGKMMGPSRRTLPSKLGASWLNPSRKTLWVKEGGTPPPGFL